MFWTKTKLGLQVAAIIVFCCVWAALPAYATGNKGQDHTCQGGHNCNDHNGGNQDQDQDQSQGQKQGQEQGQKQGQEQAQEQVAEGGSAVNEGIDIDASENNTIENNSSNTVLVPNNNTESCLRVWGVAWGDGGKSGALGVPWRSKKCDFEHAADDAFAAGEREIGWFWKCQNANLYKSFKDKDEKAEKAQQDCHNAMVGGVTSLKTIDTLREQLTTSEELRQLEYNRNKESTARINEACNESKNRILEACTTK